MKISEKFIQRFVDNIFAALKEQKQIEFKTREEKVIQRAQELVRNDFRREQELDADVMKMMDELERQNPGEFQRYKMFPLLKKRLAKERGIVL